MFLPSDAHGRNFESRSMATFGLTAGSNRLGDRRTGLPKVDTMPARSLCRAASGPESQIIICHYLFGPLSLAVAEAFFSARRRFAAGLFAVAVNQIFDSAIGQHPDRLLPVGNPILSKQ